MPMTLGNAAAAQVRLIVWCLDCRHQGEPDPAEMAERYGAETTVPEWHERLVCSECGSRRVDMVVSGVNRGAIEARPPVNPGTERRQTT
jgi:Zn finger protein HypA/HybF involved in hydrogenase expression